MKQQSVIQDLVGKLVEFCHPHRVYVFSLKVNLQNEVTSFKLCIVAPTTDKLALERDIYLNFDCPLPFDVVVYTVEEWSRFTQQAGSFAKTIFEKGWLVYGQEAQ